jgi:hypothetical protein
VGVPGDLLVGQHAIAAALLEVLAHPVGELDAGGRVAGQAAAVRRPVEHLRQERPEAARRHLRGFAEGYRPRGEILEQIPDVALGHLVDRPGAPPGQDVGVELPAIHLVAGDAVAG